MTSCGSPGYVGTLLLSLLPQRILFLFLFHQKEHIKQIIDHRFQYNTHCKINCLTSCVLAAPEILTAESYDKSVDMWSVGVIIYILYAPVFIHEKDIS
jgi:serine/threonine protein kinase